MITLGPHTETTGRNKSGEEANGEDVAGLAHPGDWIGIGKVYKDTAKVFTNKILIKALEETMDMSDDGHVTMDAREASVSWMGSWTGGKDKR